LGIGVAAIAATRIAAAGGGIPTLCLGLAVIADRDGERVSVADLRVAGIGVAAITAGRSGVSTGRVVVALLDIRLVVLLARRPTGAAGRVALEAFESPP
jgi:hypothetical protein